MIPQINTNTTSTTLLDIPSKTYKLVISTIDEEPQDRINGFVDNLEAVKQAIYHILMTERYAYLIYSENYGVELRQYIGRDFEYLQMSIESTLKDALMYDLRIKDVVVTDISKDNDIANVKFTVYSIYGDLKLEVRISV